MKTSNGLSDFFDDIKAAGQDAIDYAAGQVGIEKGGVIDKAATTAADVGKKAGIIPGNSSGNGYIDNDTFEVIDKITGGTKKTAGSTGATSTGTPAATGTSATIRTSNNTGIAPSSSERGTEAVYPATLDRSGGILQKVNPLWTGTAAALLTFWISRRPGMSAAVGGGVAVAQHAYNFNRIGV